VLAYDDSSLVCLLFSSRRRHTRSKRDWSSDVCSSDLALGEIASKLAPSRPISKPCGESGYSVSSTSRPAALSRSTKALQVRTGRSEEHTSELQSRFDLVCRLLLEKKKQQ